MSRHRSNVGSDGEVTVDGIPLMLVPGTYDCHEAERFGEKMSVGDLRYSDFRPGESGFATTDWSKGYGLRRYSDLGGGNMMPYFGYGSSTPGMVLEADGVETGDAGMMFLSPLSIFEPLPGSTDPVVWICEFLG
jgi:hypothetical protein